MSESFKINSGDVYYILKLYNIGYLNNFIRADIDSISNGEIIQEDADEILIELAFDLDFYWKASAQSYVAPMKTQILIDKATKEFKVIKLKVSKDAFDIQEYHKSIGINYDMINENDISVDVQIIESF